MKCSQNICYCFMLNVEESSLLGDLIRVSLIKASTTSKRPGSRGSLLQVYSRLQDDPLPPQQQLRASQCPDAKGLAIS